MNNPRDNAPSDKEMVSKSRLAKTLWLLAGFFFVGIGMVGVVVPGLPTTPFMLLAAGCFARSSRRFYRWIMTNRLFGRQVRRFREGRGISLRGKVISVSAMTIFIALAVIFFVPGHLLWVKVMVCILGIIGVAYILSRPTDMANNNH